MNGQLKRVQLDGAEKELWKWVIGIAKTKTPDAHDELVSCLIKKNVDVGKISDYIDYKLRRAEKKIAEYQQSNDSSKLAHSHKVLVHYRHVGAVWTATLMLAWPDFNLLLRQAVEEVGNRN